MEPSEAVTPHAESPLCSACQTLVELAATVTDLLNRTVLEEGLESGERRSLQLLAPSLQELVDVIQRRLKDNSPGKSDAATMQPIAVNLKTLEAATRRTEFGRALAEELCAVAGIPGNQSSKGSSSKLTDPIGFSGSAGPQGATGPGGKRVRNTNPRRETLTQAGLAPLNDRSPYAADELLPTLLRDLGDGHSIQGTATSLPIDAVFQFLSRTKKTGCLAVRLVDRTLRFVVVEGNVVFTVSDPTLESERLGKILVETGAIKLHELADFLSEHKPCANRPLGAELMDSGLIEEDGLAKALAKQVRDRANAAQMATHAAYAFYPGAGAAIDEFHADILELMLEAARSRDERSRVRSVESKKQR